MSTTTAAPSREIAVAPDLILEEQQASTGVGAPEDQPSRWVGQLVTTLVVFGPLVGVLGMAVGLLGPRATIPDIVLAASLFFLSGHGVSVGFHRLFAHRSFRAARWLKIILAVVGSFAVEGSVNSWVANHRRHHAYTDRPGDPHSPFEYGSSAWALVRGAAHAHVGWLFKPQATEEARWAPDLIRDRDLVLVSRLFPVLGVASFGVPMLIGWAITRTWAGALGGLVWGGAVRVFVLHQTTFAVNSVCHMWGRRPFRTRERDRATNFAPLAVLSMGENWHNFHHSCPRSARHGVDRFQLDSTARLIRIFERAGAAKDVRWPDASSVEHRRLNSGRRALPR